MMIIMIHVQIDGLKIKNQTEFLSKLPKWGVPVNPLIKSGYGINFLIEKDLVVHDIKTLLNGLKLVGDYLDKTILKPNNLNYPNSRLLFLDSFK